MNAASYLSSAVRSARAPLKFFISREGAGRGGGEQETRSNSSTESTFVSRFQRERSGLVRRSNRYRAAMPRNWLLTLIALSDPFKRAFTKRRRTQKFNTVYGSRPVFGLPGILEKLNSPESGEFIFKPGGVSTRFCIPPPFHGIRANSVGIYEARRTSGGNYYYYYYYYHY